MADTLNLFPARAAIGSVDASGRVYMTPEFSRALAALLTRVGGPISGNLNDIELEVSTPPTQPVAALFPALADLEHRLAQADELTARLAELRKQVAALEAQLVQVTPPTDWEHPGKIGQAKANSGKFTTLDAAGKTTLNPAGQAVELKPTGTGTVTIQPATTGTIDNMTLGATTAKPASVTTLGASGLASLANGVRVSGPAALAATAGQLFSYEYPNFRCYVGDGTGYSFRFSQRTGGVTSDLVTITDTGSLSVAWKFGCNGKVAQASAPLGAAATDAASTQTLVNNIRTALIANGIGS